MRMQHVPLCTTNRQFRTTNLCRVELTATQCQGLISQKPYLTKRPYLTKYFVRWSKLNFCENLSSFDRLSRHASVPGRQTEFV